ncbi:MAG: DNA-binding protein [Oscillospiraceae bacterium]|nr:DNA-binding protein [Oscillospiraceae bacterium]
MEFMSVRDTALLWKISERRVQKFCEDGRVEGILRFGHSWMIPKDAKKPVDLRKARTKERGEQPD